MSRVAAIDCGTNSIRLLIADRDESGTLTDVVRRMEIVRLGQGVDVTGRIAPEAMERTLARAAEYAALCREHDVQAARFVATSASRDAQNAQEFVTGVRAAFGDLDVAPEVISGAEEAALSFAGATAAVTASGAPGPYLVVDLGGGSTELVRGTEAPEQAWSMDVGCVRMTERHLRSDPPTEAEIDAATADVEAALDEAEKSVDLTGIATVVGLAGSITTITARALGLDSYQPERIHGAQLSLDQAVNAADSLLHSTRAERAAMPYMHPGRVDVIGAGALVWTRVLARLQERSQITGTLTSETDILDGIALSVPID
ncbi:exopolyphosphatase [Dermacoccaceae bacterium W4C1]